MELGRQVFSVDLLERDAAKGRGVITCMAAGNDVIVLGTSKGSVIRHDFGVGDSYDIDLSVGRPGEQSIHRVFVDPGGSHCIATVIGNGGADTFYTHAKWSRPRMLNKLKGLVVNAVAWNRQQITEASTREVILGTDNGQLHEIAVDEKDKKEKYIKFLFELIELPEAFTGLQMETASVSNGTRYYVMAVTPTRLYSFTGIGSLDTVFASYLDRAVHFMELPGEIPNSELHFFIKQRRAVHFAWLSGAGIYHGGLNFGALHSSPDGDENFVENKALLNYSKLCEGAEAVKPSSLAVSEFHFLLLIGNKVKVVNRISEQIIEELQFDQTPEPASKGIIGLCSDASAGLFYTYDQNSIFQVSVNDEGRDMWKVYLDLGDYAAALVNCRDQFQRDQVYLVQAEAAFSDKDFFRAASFYAKINYILSFEEITLKFISLSEQDALRTFLLRKLDNLAKDDRCQITMISTWATELYLDKINRLLLEDDTVSENHSSEYHAIIKEFRAFLSDCKDVLDEATTMKLLESYGRVDELVYFASLKEQYEIVIHHYIQQGEAKKALEVLQKPAVPLDLQYKFAPDLIMLDAYETVESWMTTKNLNPRKLIPAMMRYSSEPHAKNETHEVIKYLEFCVHRLLNEDPGVHNLLLSLYAKQEDDSALLRFLQCKFGKGRPNGPEFFYDPKYALRLCLKEKRMRACVHIYSMMSMHEEAVALALQVDPELAMAEADKVEDDEDLRKKLWLMVAKHVVEQEKGTKRENIRKAIAFLKETDGLLKIEDILPFFPDFALIDDFKEAICSSLEDYNKQIEQLKQEMNDATHGADNIRNDINALAQRYAIIKRDEDCGVCRRKILTTGGEYRMARSYTSMGSMAPFYVFPCEHAFHAPCLIAHVTRCTSQSQAEYILDLQKQLTLLGGEPKKEVNGSLTEEEAITSLTTVDKIRSQLDDAIASECPFCGDLMIREISLPFILPEEAHQFTSWEIKPQNLGSQKTLSLTL
ncbi:vacuolar sorting protein 18 [Cornus florida]|uniref:vacuolar sorting protein 18 n=1 Tax=Cornus florida TaxID=4283 RepID=UPI00289E1FDE|nr:vacuolar sorting protein 18 [Cornus florida]XP_059629452.1 vacuolar sorting protein 18 [Cornus florida]XP_059629453.1 vacuolar sorting protein 18 [Cornus florida]XP_059629454.1 vacuolar sorting protein 18 [Cornus florida]